MIISYIVGIIISYLIGGIPFGYVIAVAKGIDIRTEGSGNIGATNVGRVLGKKYGLIIFVLDMLKGFIVVFFVPTVVSSAVNIPTTTGNLLVVLCGFCAVLGHAFPVFLNFKGGKAVATSFGVFIWLVPISIGIAFGVWLITVIVTRYVSLGSMLGSLSLIGTIIFIVDSPFGNNLYLTAMSVAVAILIVARHTPNIQRIIAGTEKKVFSKEDS
ncbi:MAG: Glycerol-3-phosphate acyltransferase [Candidatus Scalindua arabica]|uniref:Glycerol-3-phosphate acyltransferase n=1 Tax=Candidatus Scalindua arabica TaxID=1127984 RepID=A0A941W507_9BACT|nr:Glycerol-3-phosphate acyltransferase [Candidatus Scalindua arabica]